MFPSGLGSSQPAQHHRRDTTYIAVHDKEEALLRTTSAGLHPGSQPWGTPQTPERGGRVQSAHASLPGKGTWVSRRVGAPLTPLAGQRGGSCPQPRGANRGPAHLGGQAEKGTSARSVSVHIPGTRLLLPAPTCRYADIKATAKRQLVRDPLIYVTLNVGRSTLGGGGKNISVAAFQRQI